MPRRGPSERPLVTQSRGTHSQSVSAAVGGIARRRRRRGVQEREPVGCFNETGDRLRGQSGSPGPNSTWRERSSLTVGVVLILSARA